MRISASVAGTLIPVVLVSIAFLTIVPTALYAQDSPNQSRIPHILQHDTRSFAALLDERSGTPTWIIDVDSLDFTLGQKKPLSTKQHVATAAKEFLAAYSDALNIRVKELELERVRTDGTLWYIGYSQRYKGLPVVNAEVGLTITRSGQLVAAGVRGFPNMDIDATPQISLSSAIDIIRGRVGLETAESRAGSSLVIVPTESTDSYAFDLAWEITIEDSGRPDPINKTFFVDAHDGTVIAEYDNVLEHASPDGLSEWVSPGLGLPATKLVDVFRPGLSEPGLRPEEARTGALRGVNSVWGYVKLNYYETPDNYTLQNIRHLDQPFYDAKITVTDNQTSQSHTTYADVNGYYSIAGLNTGSHTVSFELANQKAYVETGLSSAERKKDFNLNVSGATRKDYDWNWGDDGDGGLTSYALNGVYHVREMHDYFEDTYSFDGMDGWGFRIRVQSSSKGSTSPGGGQTFIINLGGAEAMSSEVTLHEYSHDVIYQLYGGEYIRTSQSGEVLKQAAAMDEGFADYFSADMTDHQMYGGPEADADPQAPSGDGVAIRYLWNTCSMNDIDGGWPCGGSEHSRGRIIAGAMWRVRNQIGSEANHLLFSALQIQPFARTFEDLRARLVAADNARNSGANNSVIEQKFTDRYIGGPDAPYAPLIILDANGFPKLAWLDNSVVEDGYRVQRKFNSGSWSTIDDVAANTTQYLDSDYRCLGGGSGVYYYRLQAYNENPGNPDEVSYSSTASIDLSTCDTGPAKSGAGISVTDAEAPRTTSLETAYPNPFNPRTRIRYSLAERGPVRLTVSDVLGREVAVLAERIQEAGQHEITFDASRLSSGLYFCRLEVAGRFFTRSLVVAK